MTPISDKPPLSVLLAAPRGFCAGVDRAIQIVERALERYGAPVYVRHEIVHNRHVVSRLEGLGAIFVDEVSDVPEGKPVIFSAHGVPQSVPKEALERGLPHIDATCPLVSKVHVEAQRWHDRGLDILLIGHAGHPEVIGTMGQLPEGAIELIETIEDARRVAPRDETKLALTTQTTLSFDDTAEIVAVLKERFPDLVTPHAQDICYATTNRQNAVKAIAARCDVFFVIGAPNSSNSMRLVEVASRTGCPNALLVQRAADIDWRLLDKAKIVGVSAGASAPDILVEELLDSLRQKYAVTVEEISIADENITFRLPRMLNEETDEKKDP